MENSLLFLRFFRQATSWQFNAHIADNFWLAVKIWENQVYHKTLIQLNVSFFLLLTLNIKKLLIWSFVTSSLCWLYVTCNKCKSVLLLYWLTLYWVAGGLLLQDSDGEKSDVDLVVDVGKEGVGS